MILNHIWIFVLIICILPSKQQLCTFSWRPSPFLELYLKCFALFTLSKIFPSCILLPIFNGADSASHLRSILAMLLGKNIKETNEPIPPLPYLSISIFYQEKYRCKLFLIQRKHWQFRWVGKNSKLLGCSRPSWIPAARSKVTWETAALEEIHIPRISNYTETGFRVTHTRDLWFLIFLWISWFLQKQRSVGFFSSVQSQCQTDVSFYHKMSYLIFPSWSCFEFMLQLFQNPANEWVISFIF